MYCLNSLWKAIKEVFLYVNSHLWMWNLAQRMMRFTMNLALSYFCSSLRGQKAHSFKNNFIFSVSSNKNKNIDPKAVDNSLCCSCSFISKAPNFNKFSFFRCKIFSTQLGLSNSAHARISAHAPKHHSAGRVPGSRWGTDVPVLVSTSLPVRGTSFSWIWCHSKNQEVKVYTWRVCLSPLANVSFINSESSVDK